MSFFCNFTNDSDCSTLFEQVHVSFTAIQATLAIIIVFTSIPINLLLIAAMIYYHKVLDNSVIIVILVLISNTIVSVFVTGQIAISAIARSWFLGRLGCQIIAFIGACGLTLRWITVGLVSFDRFCRVFWPFAYQRHEKKVIITILITSCAVAILLPTVVVWLCNSYAFNVSIPGCVFTVAPDNSLLETVTTNTIFAVSFIFCLFFPGIFYTIVYYKARKIRKSNQVAPAMVENSDTTSERREAQRRANQATLRFVLMMFVFFAVNFLIMTDLVIRVITQELEVSTKILIPLGFLFSILIPSYVLVDVAIIFSDKQQREAVKNFLKKIK